MIQKSYLYRSRRAVKIENDYLRVTILEEGGHIAEMLDKRTGVNPLWTPPWPSIEPSSFNPSKNPEYGNGSDAKLLAGIMGHNLCLDVFGGPSIQEETAGMGVHGEGAVAPYEIEGTGSVTLRTRLPLTQIQFERSIDLHDRGLQIRESVENLCAFDRPIGWTQHVTLGPPFLEPGVTQFRASISRSKSFESAFGRASYLKPGATFRWPNAPRCDHGFADLSVFGNAPISSAFTTHLMDPQCEHAFFLAFSPTHHMAFGYIWNRIDFPWLGIWEENRSRLDPPWNGNTVAQGMEFGVSPMPESRREMVARSRLFGMPTYRWLPAKSRLKVEYWVVFQSADSIPTALELPPK